MTRRIPIALAIVVGYAALALLLYRPIYPLDPTRLPRGAFGDPVQMTWFLEWTAQAVVHGGNPWQTTALDVPLGVNLAVNTLTPLLGVLAAPITLTLGPVAAFNLLLRLSYVVSASSMCFVLRRWCPWWPAAVVGGLLYGFGPYALSQGRTNAHLVLLWNPLLPLLFALLDDLLVRRRRRAWVTGGLLGLVAGLQALIDVELLAEAALLALVAIVLVAALGLVRSGRPPAPGAPAAPAPVVPDVRVGSGRAADVRDGAGRLGRATLPAVAGFLVVAGASLYELVLGRRHLNGPVQSLALLDTLRYDLSSVVIPTSDQAVRTASLARTADLFVGGNLTENGGYLGPILIEGVFAILWWLRHVPVVRIAALLAGVAWCFSLGDRLTVDGRPLGVPLPGAAFAHLPLLASIVAARFALFTDGFVAAVVAIGLDRLHDRVTAGGGSGGPVGAGPAGRGWGAIGPGGRRAAVAGAAAVVVGLVTILPAGAVSEYPTGWAALAARLRAVVPRHGVVLAYPYPTSPYDAAMGWAAEDRIRFRLVGGYATVPGPAGSHQAQTAPDLTAPVAIQEMLAFDAAGRFSPYPPPPPSLTATAASRDLRQVLRADRVDVVVDWPVGHDPVPARQLFLRTLGPATWHVGDVLVWRVGAV